MRITDFMGAVVYGLIAGGLGYFWLRLGTSKIELVVGAFLVTGAFLILIVAFGRIITGDAFVANRRQSEAQPKRFESSTLEDAYADRNLAVLAFATLAREHGMRVGVSHADPAWPVVLVETPCGQVSWHLPAAELVGTWPIFPVEWDGHDVEQKRARLRSLIRISA